jgi:soluble lytic murein transglycosylase
MMKTLTAIGARPLALALCAGLVLPVAAHAQFQMTAEPEPTLPSAPQPYQAGPPPYGPASMQPAGAASTPPVTDQRTMLGQALDAAQARDMERARSLQPYLTDPVGRRLVLWAMVRYGSDRMAQDELSQALHDLWSWPATERQGGGSTGWNETRRSINTALSNADYTTAYHLAADNMLPPGADRAEAEFYAGWLALKRLGDPRLADQHFARVGEAGMSPITQSRALYWRGRAAEAMSDTLGAQVFYAQAARYDTTFYGQLASEKAGIHELVLGKDPVPTHAEKAAFENEEVVQAARMLISLGEKNLLKVFVLSLADKLSTPVEYVQLVDLSRNAGEQFLSMQVVRVAAKKGVVLPERGYPVNSTARGSRGIDPAFVHGIIRQESSFDPGVHSSAGARGMMQLMPSTAVRVARNIGQDYSPYMLENADYNVRLGTAYLTSMADTFSGSYIMAAAAYNAGPDRPSSWTSYCGDPRSSSGDPIDFIECIPFSETRNYVMRVMENTQVYRARLHGGRAPITLSKDLKRGGYVAAMAPVVANAQTTVAASAETSATPQ